MELTRLGRTGLMATRTAFGVLPIQRTDREEAARILRRAHEAGINFYDTARAYSDSEEKIGYALGGVRDEIILATKSGATTREGVSADLETSLRHLKTDRVDLLQLHNPGVLPEPDDPNSSYAALLEAQRKGMVRFIGITNHRLDVAVRAVQSGLYDTMQFPLSAISSADDLDLIRVCAEHDVGVVAMKALCGGLLTHAPAAFAFLRTYPNVVPIWGIQHMSELEEFIALEASPPQLGAEMEALIARDCEELAGNFCRACGYCLPCPAEIPIPMAGRMSLLLDRMPYQQFLSDDWYEQMHRIDNCIECGKCRERCPYDLDTPKTLKKMLAAYVQFYAKHAGEATG